MARRRVVLLGAGHAHLFAMRRLRRIVDAGHEAVVVAPGPFWYSGLATGMLGGLYRPEQDQVDCAALVQRAGGRFVMGAAARIDGQARAVHLEDGSALAYDVLSVAVGSQARPLGEGNVAMVFPVKPVARLWDLNRAIVRAEGRLRIVVAGAGIAGCEVAANLAGLTRRLSRTAEITLLAAGPAILPLLSRSVRATVVRVLEGAGVRIRQDSRVMAVRDRAAILASGETLEWDMLVNATGLVPSPLLRRSGLPTDPAGALLVDAALRCPADPAIMGGGDCIAFCGRALPRVGVYGVRQAPVLFNSMRAALGLARIRPFRPQKRALWIMNLGDGTGLACRGAVHWHGRSALLLKDRLDRRFVQSTRAGGL